MNTLGRLAALLLAVTACGRTAETAAGPLEEIRTQYDSIAAAFNRRDPAAVLALRTPDFHIVGPNGQAGDAEEARQGLEYFFVQNHPPISVRYTILCSRVAGDEATLIIFQEASRNQELAGAMRRVDHNVTQRERWRRTPQGWRWASTDQISLRNRWVDGKRVDGGVGVVYDPDALPFVPPPPSETTCEARLAAPGGAAIP